MKKYLFTLLLTALTLGASLSVSADNRTMPAEVQRLHDEIRAEFAPDKQSEYAFHGLLPCQIAENFSGVRIRFYLGHHFFNVALLVDDKGCPHHTHAHLAVEFLLLPDTVSLNGL